MPSKIDQMTAEAKSLFANLSCDSDSEPDEVEPVITNEESVALKKNEEIVSHDDDDDDGFTKVGSNRKSVTPKDTEEPSVNPGVRVKSYLHAASSNLPETKTEQATNVKEVPTEEITEPKTFSFGKVEKSNFDKSKGKGPNFMLNPDLFEKAVYEISKRLGHSVKPQIDLFSDIFNKQPEIEKYYHYDKSNRDELFDAFTKNWGEFETVYANFHWPNMHTVIEKAMKEKVNLLTFLDISENSSSLEYYKLYKEKHLVQYIFNSDHHIWVHASESGYYKFSTSHLPRSEGKYALCFFNFGPKKFEEQGKPDSIDSKSESSRLSKKISSVTKVTPDIKDKLISSVTNAKDTSRESEVSEFHITNESVIKSLECEIETIIKKKELSQEFKSLYDFHKEKFDLEFKTYETFLQKFKTLL